MGDYSLKVSKEYAAPPHVRMDSFSKARSLALLQGHLHGLVARFNGKLLSLRALRPALLRCLLSAEREAQRCSAELEPAGSLGKLLARGGVDIAETR